MVKVHLYTLEGGLKIPLFQTNLVGFNEFTKLLTAGIIFKVGKQYAMIDKGF